ncbi:hypothetical protein BYT27DRAFT_7260747 [Phlegmacium glaucopus]|nr:hypothetical protein BYT27DRAFT_7260747 [Phlegmacium glaucopus]
MALSMHLEGFFDTSWVQTKNIQSGMQRWREAFIISVGAQRARSGYHLVEHFTSQAKSLTERAVPTRIPERIRLQWIAAHENVKGNKRADEEAKSAAAGVKELLRYIGQTGCLKKLGEVPALIHPQ